MLGRAPLSAFVAAVSALSVASCGAAPDDAARETVVRDSAAIRIVENGRDVAGAEWTAEEIVSIGRLDGPAEYTFNRLADLAVGGAGRLYALDAGDNLVKAYDASGRFLASFGGEGGGPAEFRAAVRLAVRGDSVVVYDYRNLKLAYFTADGELIGTERTGLTVFEYGFASLLGPVPGGYIVATSGTCSLPPPEDRRPKWRLYTLGLDGAIRDSLAVLPRGDVLAVYGDRFCTGIVPPFGARHVLAVSPDGFAAYGRGDRYEIRVFELDASTGPEGTVSGVGSWALPRPVRIIRRAVAPAPVTREHVDTHRDEVANRFRDEETGTIDRDRLGAAEAAMDSTAVPEHWPAFDDLLWDDRGRLWVGRGARPDEPTRQWDVFDPAGRFLARVALPADFDVRVVGDTVWGIVRDELDVQRITAYRVAG